MNKNWPSCSKNGGGSLALVKFDMDLAILHHFPGGIALFKSSEVSVVTWNVEKKDSVSIDVKENTVILNTN